MNRIATSIVSVLACLILTCPACAALDWAEQNKRVLHALFHHDFHGYEYLSNPVVVKDSNSSKGVGLIITPDGPFFQFSEWFQPQYNNSAQTLTALIAPPSKLIPNTNLPDETIKRQMGGSLSIIAPLLLNSGLSTSQTSQITIHIAPFQAQIRDIHWGKLKLDQGYYNDEALKALNARSTSIVTHEIVATTFHATVTVDANDNSGINAKLQAGIVKLGTKFSLGDTQFSITANTTIKGVYEIESLMPVLIARKIERKPQHLFVPATHQNQEDRLLPPLPGRIVISLLGKDGKHHLYIRYADATLSGLPTGSSDDESFPSVSRDGKKVVWKRERHLFMINLDGTDMKPIASGSDNSNEGPPSWSPDGNMIAFSRLVDKDADDAHRESQICIVDVGTGKVTSLTQGKHDGHPTWSADGNTIAFHREGESGNLWTVSVAAPHIETQLTHTVAENNVYPSWSPDGKKIAFVKEKANSGIQIYVMASDGSGAKSLTSGPGEWVFPSWIDNETIICGKRPLNYFYKINVNTLDSEPIPIESVADYGIAAIR